MSLLFTQQNLGPLTLKNRSIRSAAFEGMSQDHMVTDDLIAYHRSVAKGGVGMTTVAYASVSRDGLSFPHQLLLDENAKPGLAKLVKAVHEYDTPVSIQIGHTGNMSKRSVTGKRPISASGRFNLYGPTWPRRMSSADIERVVNDFGRSTELLRSCGFNAVEVHAGHGYLISQFLSPFTNRRKDEYGGSFENRSRFLRMVIRKVKAAAGREMAVVVKMNVSDGFTGGMDVEGAVQTAKLLESEGVDAIVLSGGFVSRSPMYIMKGSMPLETMARQLDNPVAKIMVKWMGNLLMKPELFKEAFFLDDALAIREGVNLPLILVGGMNSRETIEGVLKQGFEFVAIARALIQDPSYIQHLQENAYSKSACNTCNHCVAVINSGKVECPLINTEA